MATLQVRSIDDQLYKALGKLAARESRSISQQVITILKSYLANPENHAAKATDEFLELSWDDSREAKEIIKDIMDRKSKPRFEKELSDVFT